MTATADKTSPIAVRASLGDLRMSPRKVRLVTDMVKGMPIRRAEVVLQFANKKAAPHILKLIKSATANATSSRGVDPETLVVKSIVVNQGVTLQRFKPRARGRAFPILRRTSRVTVLLEGSLGAPEKQKKPRKTSTKTSVKSAKAEPEHTHSDNKE